MFKNLTNLASAVRQAQQMGGKLQEINDQLRERRIVGSAGGGLVEAEVNGLGEVLRLRIAPQLLGGGDADLIESLAPAAVNQAMEKARQTQAEAMQSLVGDVPLPGLQEMFSQWTGSPSGGPRPPSSS